MPRIRIRRGDTLILYGPASALLIDGRASILDCPLSSRKKLIVKGWRSKPIYAEEDSVIDFTCGEGGGYEVIEGDTIPEEWRVFAEKSSEHPSKVCVYGAVDSGKTTLATLIANALVKRHGLSAYLDLDLGQSNICPPTTIGYASLRSPVPDISYLRMEVGEVAGYTSPSPLVDKHIRAVQRLMGRLLENYQGVGVSIDLDGWVSGEQAVKHKERVLKVLKPDFLASIGEIPGEVEKACKELGISNESLPPPRRIRRREQPARRRLREIAYEKFLRRSVVRKVPMSWVEVEAITGKSSLREVEEHVKMIIQAYAERSGEILDQDLPEALEELAKRGIGILSYLRDPAGEFVGIGLLMSFDVRKNFLKLLTPYQAQIKGIILGAMLLSANGEEVYSDPRIFSLSHVS